MNYLTKNPKVNAILEKVFQFKSPSGRVNLAVDYSQNRRLTAVILQLEHTNLIHGLIFYYNRSYKLYDVLMYRNRAYWRVGELKRFALDLDFIDKFIQRNIPRSNQINPRYLKESENIWKVKYEVLKTQLDYEKSKAENLRSQIKSLRDQITLLKKKLNTQ